MCIQCLTLIIVSLHGQRCLSLEIYCYLWSWPLLLSLPCKTLTFFSIRTLMALFLSYTEGLTRHSCQWNRALLPLPSPLRLKSNYLSKVLPLGDRRPSGTAWEAIVGLQQGRGIGGNVRGKLMWIRPVASVFHTGGSQYKSTTFFFNFCKIKTKKKKYSILRTDKRKHLFT